MLDSDNNQICNQIKLIRKYLKLKIVEDNISFRGHREERHHVYDLMKRTILHGESHSALMIGPRGSGKTTLVNSVLYQLGKEVDLNEDAIIVKLNGLIHSDEKIALKSITAQMQLENALGDRVFGTFAENFAFLLSCIQSGGDRRCKSMIFILEQMDMFCKAGRSQTLLYNLFDITHSGDSPICVLGVTNYQDVMELLEKRVKSRFSNRHISLYPIEDNQSPTEYYMQVMIELLSMPVTKPVKRGRRRQSSVSALDTNRSREFSISDEVLHRCGILPNTFDELEPTFVRDWNAHIAALAKFDNVTNAIEKFCYYTLNEQIFRNVLFQLVSKLRPTSPFIDQVELSNVIDKTVAPQQTVKLLHSLSVLELSLVVAMKHGMDIFDQQPMNFEMVLHRYKKFANTNSSTQTVPRPVILKAFEHLQELEIIRPIKTSESISNNVESTGRVQKEYKLYTLAILADDISEAIKTAKALPTEICHWYNNSVA